MKWPWDNDIRHLQREVDALKMATPANQIAAMNTLSDRITAIAAAVAALVAAKGETSPEQDAALQRLTDAVAALGVTAGA